MATAYRFGIFDMEQLVLLDGHLVYHEPSVAFCLWTYDYDVDTTTYAIDGYIKLKHSMTTEEVMALPFFAEHGCICLSPATADDQEYYTAIHTSVRGGWKPDQCDIHTVTPVLETDEVLPPGDIPAAPIARTEECHDLSAFMESDDLPEGMLYTWTLPSPN